MENNKMHEKIKGPAVAVDTVVMAIIDNILCTLLIKIGSGLYKDKWAIPGGLLQLDETPDEAAMRVLEVKANIKVGYLEQLYTFGEIDRDVRGQIISISYILLINDPELLSIKTQNFYSEIKWFDIREIPSMAFDHEKIINFAYQRLKGKMGYSNIAQSLLPTEFTLSNLQHVYEVILGETLDKRNFRKKILASKIIIPTDKKRQGNFRPALLYKFAQGDLAFF